MVLEIPNSFPSVSRVFPESVVARRISPISPFFISYTSETPKLKVPRIGSTCPPPPRFSNAPFFTSASISSSDKSWSFEASKYVLRILTIGKLE